MLNPIDLRLQQLIALWIDGSPVSLQRIPLLCDQIEELAADGGFTGNPDRDLIRRAGRLSAKAEQRLVACLEIQSRTGSYSTRGALELLPHMVTAGWEG
jgi:hypothetical protein